MSTDYPEDCLRLAQHTDVSIAGYETLLTRYGMKDFITRSAVAKDARLKRLIATEKGRACHKQIEASIARFEDDLQSGIDPQQVAAARAVLEQTLRNAQHFLQEENTKQERGNTNC